MHRRNFIKSITIAGSGIAISGIPAFTTADILSPPEVPWYDKSMRWAQLAFVENDPGNYDPEFWIDYFRKIHALNISAVAEALILAQKAGVSPDLVYNAIRGGLAGNTVMDAKAPLMMDRNFTPGFRIDLHIKDMNNALEASRQFGTPLPLSAAVMEMMQAVKADGFEKEDHCSLVKYYEKITNLILGR